jgi:short-subunit dehydrogenase involved in D-alanine esterification of teichoic acids
MPLNEFIAETMSLLQTRREDDEIVVERAKQISIRRARRCLSKYLSQL